MNPEQQGVDSLSDFFRNDERPNNLFGLICDGYFHHSGCANCSSFGTTTGLVKIVPQTNGAVYNGSVVALVRMLEMSAKVRGLTNGVRADGAGVGGRSRSRFWRV
jgi:hypothetical protein